MYHGNIQLINGNGKRHLIFLFQTLIRGEKTSFFAKYKKKSNIKINSGKF